MQKREEIKRQNTSQKVKEEKYADRQKKWKIIHLKLSWLRIAKVWREEKKRQNNQ